MVTKETLDKILVYCTHIKDNSLPEIQKPLKSNDLEVEQWYKDYINVSQELLFEVIMAADKLDCQSLLELASA